MPGLLGKINFQIVIVMNISRENIDALNAVIKVDIATEDYQPRVDEVLKDYRKKANVPGFRQGMVPMGMIKKQYGTAVMVEEVNKLLQESLNKYIAEEKLDILGNPLPKEQDNFDWNAENFSFEFELGLTPEFDVDLKGAGKKVTRYNITVSEESVEEQIADIAKRYGKMSAQDEATAETTVAGQIEELEEDGKSVKEGGFSNKASFKVSELRLKRDQNKIVGKKVGDVVNFKTDKLFAEPEVLARVAGIEPEVAETISAPFQFSIEEINVIEAHELNQELFDKVFGEGAVDSEEAFRARIVEDSEKMFSNESDRHLLNETVDFLIEDTKFDLPSEFLTKWLRTAGEKELSAEEAAEEFNKSEKGLRYQLIEAKLMKDNNLEVTYQDILAKAKEMIKMQMAQFGQFTPEDKELDDIAMRVLQNQEEVGRIQNQVVSEKMLELFKSEVEYKTKDVTFEDFIAAASKK